MVVVEASWSGVFWYRHNGGGFEAGRNNSYFSDRWQLEQGLAKNIPPCDYKEIASLSVERFLSQGTFASDIFVMVFDSNILFMPWIIWQTFQSFFFFFLSRRAV